MDYGTGHGRTRHITRRITDNRQDIVKGVCGAWINPKIPREIMMAKPLCKACAKARHVNPCTHCGGTGQEPEART